MVYAITYDLNRIGQNYSDLYQSINNLGYAHHALQNLWFLDTNSHLDYIRDHLMQIIDGNDFVFVTRIIRGSYSGYLPQTAINWLEGRL